MTLGALSLVALSYHAYYQAAQSEGAAPAGCDPGRPQATMSAMPEAMPAMKGRAFMGEARPFPG